MCYTMGVCFSITLSLHQPIFDNVCISCSPERNATPQMGVHKRLEYIVERVNC